MAVVVATGACAIKPVGNLDETGSASESESAEAESSAGTSATSGVDTETVSSATQGEESSAGTSATGGDTEGGCMAGCDPLPVLGGADVAWTVDGDAGEFIDVALDEIPCVVAEFATDEITMTITLECDEGELSQHVVVAPHNPVTPTRVGMGASVLLSHHVENPFWSNAWFALRGQAGNLLLGGVNGSSLYPVADDALFAPVAMSVLEDVCGPECPDRCGAVVREAIEAQSATSTVTIYDGNEDNVGESVTHRVIVGEASGFDDFGACSDIPSHWYAILLYELGEG